MDARDNGVGRVTSPAANRRAWSRGRQSESGQIFTFFVFTILGLGLLTAAGLEIGRIVYARSEVGKAADAAALAAASRLDLVLYRETGRVQFLPDARATAQQYARMNAQFLTRRKIGITIEQIWIDAGSRQVRVTVTADLSPLLPGFLSSDGLYRVTGFSEFRQLHGR